MIPKNNEIYRHFKGNLYKIITIATHSETGEQMVVYQALYGDLKVYCRPLAMFVSEVDHEKYPHVTQRFRFERVENLVNVDADENSKPEEMKRVEGKASDVNKEKIEENAQDTERTEETKPAEDAEDTKDVDPLILEFLDAESIAQKRNILTALHHRITDEMINTLAVVMDVVIEEGDIEDRYQQLKTCLTTIEKYEIERKY